MGNTYKNVFLGVVACLAFCFGSVWAGKLSFDIVRDYIGPISRSYSGKNISMPHIRSFKEGVTKVNSIVDKVDDPASFYGLLFNELDGFFWDLSNARESYGVVKNGCEYAHYANFCLKVWRGFDKKRKLNKGLSSVDWRADYFLYRVAGYVMRFLVYELSPESGRSIEDKTRAADALSKSLQQIKKKLSSKRWEDLILYSFDIFPSQARYLFIDSDLATKKEFSSCVKTAHEKMFSDLDAVTQSLCDNGCFDLAKNITRYMSPFFRLMLHKRSSKTAEKKFGAFVDALVNALSSQKALLFNLVADFSLFITFFERVCDEHPVLKKFSAKLDTPCFHVCKLIIQGALLEKGSENLRVEDLIYRVPFIAKYLSSESRSQLYVIADKALHAVEKRKKPNLSKDAMLTALFPAMGLDF